MLGILDEHMDLQQSNYLNHMQAINVTSTLTGKQFLTAEFFYSTHKAYQVGGQHNI